MDLYRPWKGIKISNELFPFKILGIGIVPQVLDLKVFFKSKSKSDVSQALCRAANKQTPIPEPAPLKWCCCDPEMGTYRAPSGHCVQPSPTALIPSNPIWKLFWPHLKTEWIPGAKVVATFSSLCDVKGGGSKKNLWFIHFYLFSVSVVL